MEFLRFLLVFQINPSTTILLFPFLLLNMILITLGLALPLSTLNVRYKDIQYIWGVILHAGFFLCPIFYSFDMLPLEIRDIVKLNPIAQIIDMAHDTILYNTLPTFEDLTYTVVISIVIFLIGIVSFQHFKKRIVEEL